MSILIGFLGFSPILVNIKNIYRQYASHRTSIDTLFKDLQKAVRDEFAAGTPAFEIFTKVKLPQYSLTQYDNWFPLNVQAMVVNEVLGPLSWRSGRDAAPGIWTRPVLELRWGGRA